MLPLLYTVWLAWTAWPYVERASDPTCGASLAYYCRHARCPRTLDTACGAASSRTTSSCADTTAVSCGGGYSGVTYHFQDGKLVGAFEWTDDTPWCNDTEFTISYGYVPECR